MELTVIAKPYAKAISEIAMAENSYASWQELLIILAAIIKDDNTKDFLSSPSSTRDNKINLLTNSVKTALARDLNSKEQNFINILVDNDRVLASGSIIALFNSIATNNIKNIAVFSAYELSSDDVVNLTNILKDKYSCEISLTTEVDRDLSAGLVIKDGDKVVDLSISARLNSLNACLSI